MKDCLTGIASVHRGQVGRYFLCSVLFSLFVIYLSFSLSLSSFLTFNPLSFIQLAFFAHFLLHPAFPVVSPSLPPSRSECRGQWRSGCLKWKAGGLSAGLINVQILQGNGLTARTATRHTAGALIEISCRKLKSILKGAGVYHSWSFIVMNSRMVDLGLFVWS